MKSVQITESMPEEYKTACGCSVVQDRGWAWMIVIASFILQGLAMGIPYTFGIIFVALIKEFKDVGATSWIGSIQPGLVFLTGNTLYISCHNMYEDQVDVFQLQQNNMGD